MGIARRKKLAGIPTPAERTPPPEKARRLGFRPIRVHSSTYKKDYLVHLDGRVYEVRVGKSTRSLIRVRNADVVDLARTLAMKQVGR